MTTIEKFRDTRGFNQFRSDHSDYSGWFVAPDLCMPRDYGTHLMERANYQVLCEEADALDVEHTILSSYVLLEPSVDARELLEELSESLEKHPLLDEELLTELEWAATEEAWESHGTLDFLSDVRFEGKELGFDPGDAPGDDGWEERAFKLYMETTSETPFEDGGHGIYFPKLDTFADSLDDDDFAHIFPGTAASWEAYKAGREDGRSDHGELARELHRENYGGDHTTSWTNCPGLSCRALRS